MSKVNQIKHMGASGEDSFEDKLQGDIPTSLHDYAAQLGMEILDAEHKIDRSRKSSTGGNQAVIHLLENRLSIWNGALELIDKDPRLAQELGGQGGVKAMCDYIVAKAKEQATKEELSGTITKVMAGLPGRKVAVLTNSALAGGMSRAAARGAAASSAGGASIVP